MLLWFVGDFLLFFRPVAEEFTGTTLGFTRLMRVQVEGNAGFSGNICSLTDKCVFL